MQLGELHVPDGLEVQAQHRAGGQQPSDRDPEHHSRYGARNPAQREAHRLVVVSGERLHRLLVRGEKHDDGTLRRLEARPRVGVGQVRVVAQVPFPRLDAAVDDHRKAIAEAGVAAGGLDALDYVRHVG